MVSAVDVLPLVTKRKAASIAGKARATLRGYFDVSVS